MHGAETLCYFLRGATGFNICIYIVITYILHLQPYPISPSMGGLKDYCARLNFHFLAIYFRDQHRVGHREISLFQD